MGFDFKNLIPDSYVFIFDSLWIKYLFLFYLEISRFKFFLLIYFLLDLFNITKKYLSQEDEVDRI
jgi:deoxyadenosine/deoxycytidine kinase